jgi:uncharacterized protein YfiM (DUF2279 family)
MIPASKMRSRGNSEARLNFIGGAAVGAAAGMGLGLMLHRGNRGRAVIRLLFALAIGVGSYWQEKRRARELAAHLSK